MPRIISHSLLSSFLLLYLRGVSVNKMLLSTLLLAATLLGPFQAEARKYTVSHPIASRNALPLTVSSNIPTLPHEIWQRIQRPSAAHHFRLVKIPTDKHIATLTSLDFGEAFAAEVTFGKEEFLPVVNTGSSDTWIAETGFQCHNVSSGAPESEESRNFGPTYNISKTFSMSLMKISTSHT